ncbi:hypothetical protein P3G55_10880 [Leptospira sp. 96542]|nr:hypothetical protein [Leptospira sp. 96542]
MSLCHPELGSVSCGSCCGLFNLKLTIPEFKKILQDRTELFRSTVNFQVRHSFPIYRKERETVEANYPKEDEMTYNCPFLGYVDENNNRIGCMIHPVFTGDPKSQNFSFYGTSICQTYDCKNKESILTEKWESLFVEIAKDSVQYSFLSADHIFCYVIERFFALHSLTMDVMFSKYRTELISVFLARLEKTENLHLTSFEINYDSFGGLEEVVSYLKKELGDVYFSLEGLGKPNH